MIKAISAADCQPSTDFSQWLVSELNMDYWLFRRFEVAFAATKKPKKKITKITIDIGNFPIRLFVSYNVLLGIDTLTLAMKRQNAMLYEHRSTVRNKKIIDS